MDVDFIRAMDAIISNGYNDRPLSWHFRARPPVPPEIIKTSSSTANKNTSLSIPKPSCPNHLLPFLKTLLQVRFQNGTVLYLGFPHTEGSPSYTWKPIAFNFDL